ncbi:MAG: SigE family RNA polymerase sigma factor [Sciscionella sp.]
MADEPPAVVGLDEVYVANYASLVRLAALLLDGSAACEDVVQEAWIRVHLAAGQPHEPEAVLAYLRQTVVNLSRSALRRRLVARKHAATHAPDEPSAEELAFATVDRGAVVAAVRRLPVRQREAVALRYFAGQSEKQTAAAMGVSVGAVKSATSRGLDALGRWLEETL